MKAKEKAAKGRTAHRPGDEKDLPGTRRNPRRAMRNSAVILGSALRSRFYAISRLDSPLALLMVLVSFSHGPP